MSLHAVKLANALQMDNQSRTLDSPNEQMSSQCAQMSSVWIMWTIPDLPAMEPGLYMSGKWAILWPNGQSMLDNPNEQMSWQCAQMSRQMSKQWGQLDSQYGP